MFPTLFDGFGFVVGEAMSYGVPVMTTTRAGAADFIQPGKNGFLIPPGDIEALQEQIDWCIRNPSSLLDMRKEEGFRMLGHDIVNHCVNDILVSGAEPLFFLDYFGTNKLVADEVSYFVKGVAEACI